MIAQRDRAKALLSQLQGRIETDEERAAFNRFAQAETALAAAREPIYNALRDQDKSTVSATLTYAKPYFDTTQKELDNVTKVITGSVARAVAAGKASYAQALVIAWVSAAVAVIASEHLRPRFPNLTFDRRWRIDQLVMR
jgi:hypothetical protein